MKITVYENQAIVDENTPLLIDIRQKNYIEVETPNDGAVYSIKFIGANKQHTTAVVDGKAELPIGFREEGTIKVIVYKATNDSVTPIFCGPLQVWHLSNTDSFLYYVASGKTILQLRNEHERMWIFISAQSKKVQELYEKLNETKSELAAVKEEIKQFKETYDNNVETINQALEKIKELEERYDTLAV